MTTNNHIGEHIRALRLQQGLSQEQLALSAQMNTSYLGQLERGVKKNPTLPTLEKISRGLNLTVEQLIAGVTPNDQPPLLQQTFFTILTTDEIKKIVKEAINETCKHAIHFKK